MYSSASTYADILTDKLQKLTSREESRQRLPGFSHPTFDGAMQLDCMSSEESDSECTIPLPSGEISSVRRLCVRGLLWRSTRLLRYFAALDAAQPSSRSPSPSPSPFFSQTPDSESRRKRRRTLQRKERCVGPPKDGFHMPPKGVASWMVSRKWLRECALNGQQDIEDRVGDLVDDSHGGDFDWDHYDGLGSETEEEEEVPVSEPYIPYSDVSYSLANALQPPPL